MRAANRIAEEDALDVSVYDDAAACHGSRMMPSGSIVDVDAVARLTDARATRRRFEPTPVVEPDDEADERPGPHGALDLPAPVP